MDIKTDAAKKQITLSFDFIEFLEFAHSVTFKNGRLRAMIISTANYIELAWREKK